MLTKVEVRTTLGQLFTLQLNDSSSGYIVEDIQGLDPVKATLVSSSVANRDGAQYQSSRREARNILIKLAFDPNWAAQSIRGLRTALYRIFKEKSEVDLRFYLSDAETVHITARVESLQSQLFTLEPKVDISLMCFDPDFLELDAVTIEEETVSDSDEFLIEYEGTTETGILFTLNVDRVLTEFSIYHRPGDNQVRVTDFTLDLEADDVFVMNTTKGEKSVTLTRDAIQSSVLYGMSPQSNWLELFPGDNHIRVLAAGAAIPFTIVYTPRHGGL